MNSDLIQEARELCARYLKSGWNIPIAFLNRVNELCDALESYKSFADRIAKLPDCNDCANNRDCPYLPIWGAMTRINCPLHKPLPALSEEGAEK